MGSMLIEGGTLCLEVSGAGALGWHLTQAEGYI